MKFNQKKWDQIVERKREIFLNLNNLQHDLNDERDLLTQTERLFSDMERRSYDYRNLNTYNTYLGFKKSGVEALEAALQLLQSDPESVIANAQEHLALIQRVKELYERAIKFKKIERNLQAFRIEQNKYLASFRSLEDFARNHIRIPQPEWVVV